MEELFNKIKRLREERKMNHVEISKEIGISNTAYSKIEKGITKSISLEIAVKIARALEVNFNELFSIESNKNNSVDNQRLNDKINTLIQENELLKKQLEDKLLLEDYFKRDILEFKSLLVSWPIEYFNTENKFIKELFDKRDILSEEYERRVSELPEKTAQAMALLIKNKLFLLADFDKYYSSEQFKPIILRVRQILAK